MQTETRSTERERERRQRKRPHREMREEEELTIGPFEQQRRRGDQLDLDLGVFH